VQEEGFAPSREDYSKFPTISLWYASNADGIPGGHQFRHSCLIDYFDFVVSTLVVSTAFVESAQHFVLSVFTTVESLVSEVFVSAVPQDVRAAIIATMAIFLMFFCFV
jgi:hypothetical protein